MTYLHPFRDPDAVPSSDAERQRWQTQDEANRRATFAQQPYPLFAVRTREPGVVYAVIGWDDPVGAATPLLVALERPGSGVVAERSPGAITYYATLDAAQAAAALA